MVRPRDRYNKTLKGLNKQIYVIKRGLTIQSISKVLREQKAQRRILDLFKESNTDSKTKAKDLENYKAKKNYIKELLRFIKEELKE